MKFKSLVVSAFFSLPFTGFSQSVSGFSYSELIEYLNINMENPVSSEDLYRGAQDYGPYSPTVITSCLQDISLYSQEFKLCYQNSLLNFIYDNLEYPSEARKRRKEGMVILEIIIEKNGTVSSLTAVRDDVKFGASEEAVRVFNLTIVDGKWIPGYFSNSSKGHRPVRSRILMPIKFKVDGNNLNTFCSWVYGEGLNRIFITPHFFKKEQHER